MAKSHVDTEGSTSRPYASQFWEVWLLALVIVTILGLYAHSRDRGGPREARLQRQFDPYDLRPEEPRGLKTLEAGY